MAEQQQSHTEEQAEEQIMVPVNPTAISTPTGLVMVWGFEHVSAKLLDVLKTMLSHDAFDSVYHGIKSVVFRVDGYPKHGDKAICASFSPDTCSVSINLEKTLEQALNRSLDHPETALFASWWLEMVLNFGHEIHHGIRWNTDRPKLHNNNKLLEEEETRAEEYGNEVIVELAQEYNIEMPSIEEETWFNSQVLELFNGKDESDTWAKAQKEMITESVLWRHEPKNSAPVSISTFKELVCLISDSDITAEEWNKPTISLTPGVPTLDEQINGKKVTINAAGEQKETVKPPPTPAATNPASSDFTGGVFVDDDEDCSDIYGEDEEYDPEPAQLVQPVVQQTTNTAQFDNQQPATTTPPQSMSVLSRIVQTVYTKMYNFIFTNCGQLRNSDIGFTNPEAVLTTRIPLTEEEQSVFVSMNHLDVNGRWCPNVSTANGLLGKVMSKTKLPAYEVVLNVNGTLHRRLFIPQNPGKRNNGVLTQRALEAQSGDTIAYTKNSETDVWGPYFVNGEYKLPRGK